MTYIVYDGKTVIADTLCSMEVGGGVFGRRPIDKNGDLIRGENAKPQTIYFDDVHKLVFPENGKYQNKEITLIALAGSVEPVAPLYYALKKGINFETIVELDIEIFPVSKRFYFNGNTSYFVLTADGQGYHLKRKGNSVSTYNTPFTHLGSGSEVVNAVRGLIPGVLQGTTPDLTSLEAYVLAAGQCETVSETFDYFIPETGEYKINQRLTEKQQMHILDKIQSRIKLRDTYRELTYVNRLPVAV